MRRREAQTAVSHEVVHAIESLSHYHGGGPIPRAECGARDGLFGTAARVTCPDCRGVLTEKALVPREDANTTTPIQIPSVNVANTWPNVIAKPRPR